MLDEGHSKLFALLSHVFRPDAGLYLTDVGFLQIVHAEA